MSSSESAPRLCVVGSVNLDTFVSTPVLPKPGETVLGFSQVHTPGGKGANQAVAAALLGARVAFVGAVGRDDAAEVVLRTLIDRNLDVSRMVRVHAPTGAAMVCVAATGENAIVVISGANAALDEEHVAAASSEIHHADALVLQAEISVRATRVAVQLAVSNGTPIILNLAPVPVDVLSWLDVVSSCDVLIMNEGEESELLGVSRRSIATLGPELVITTLGERGVRWSFKGREDALPALVPEEPIVDTVGAGDAFVGAFATRWATARIAGAQMDQSTIKDTLLWAMAAGGLACTRKGAIESLPTRAEVVQLLKRG